MGVARPAGRLPARVYWVRRFVVLGIPLLLVVLVVWLVAGRGAAADDAAGAPVGAPPPAGPPSSDDPATADPAAADPAAVDSAGAKQGGAAPDAAAGPAPSPTSATRGGVAECAAGQLALTTTAAAEAFGAGVSPAFTLSITNTGSAPCVVDSGDAYRELVVTSGPDRVWSSRDCVPAGASPRTLLLAPGGSDAQQVGWSRVRSAQGCPADLPAPGAGTYSVSFTLAGASAAPVVFGLG